MKRIVLLLFVAVFALCAGTFREKELASLGMKFRRIDTKIEGLQREYVFLWISDLHIIDGNDLSEVTEADLPVVKQRLEKAFVNRIVNRNALETWKRLPEALNACGADGVFFGGDMVDFGSLANIRAVQEGLQKLTIPWLYLRADHDLAPWWCVARHDEETNALESAMDGNPEVLSLELEDLMVVGWNKSTSPISSKGADRIGELFDKGKPVVFLTHVPLESPLAPSLANQSRASDGSAARNLTWGRSAFYSSTPAVQKVIDRITAEDSPVRLILSGHLHFDWEGPFSANAREYVFEPACSGTIGVIILHP